MEKFKKIVQNRFKLAVIYNSLFVIIITSGLIHSTVGSSQQVKDFISGTMFGIALGIEVVLVRYIYICNLAFKDESKLKEMYIEENDERNKLIKSKIGGMGINIIIAGLAVATVAAGFINSMVYFTLGGALAFSVLVKGILRLYFNKII